MTSTKTLTPSQRSRTRPSPRDYVAMDGLDDRPLPRSYARAALRLTRCLLVAIACSPVAACSQDSDKTQRPAVAAATALDSISWLTGYWANASGVASSEEAWLPPRGGVMVGVHIDRFSSGRSFFEYLRVESRGDTLIYFASPRGREAVPFVASEIAPGRAVFSNLSHDYPQHIGYTLVGTDSLKSEIWGSSDGDERRSSVTWERSNL